MILTDDSKIRDLIERYFLPAGEYDPKSFRYRFREFWDLQDVAGTAAAAPQATRWFDSSRTAHTLKASGCNLPSANLLPGNTSFLVTAVRFEPIGCTTAAKVNDANLVAENALWTLSVKGEPVLEEMPVREFCVRRGVGPNTFDNAAAAGAGVVIGAVGLEDGGALTPESFVPLVDGDEFNVQVIYNAASNTAAASKWRVSLAGLEVRARSRR